MGRRVYGGVCTTSTSFINFGASSALTLVNLSVISYFVRHRPRSGGGVVGWVVAPLVGAAVDLYLLLNLDGTAKLIGLSWLVLGVLWLAYLIRGFRQAPPQPSTDPGT